MKSMRPVKKPIHGMLRANMATDTWNREFRLRRILNRCHAIHPPNNDFDYEVHFHLFSLLTPWKRVEVGIINHVTGEGLTITPSQFAWILHSKPESYNTISDYIKGNIPPEPQTGMYL